MTDRRLDAGELELDPGDGGRGRCSFEPGEEEPLDRLCFGRRLGETLLDVEFGGRAGAGEGQVEGQPEVRPGRRRPPRLELVGESRGEPVEDEAERVELVDRWLDRQAEDQSLRGAAGAERRDLLASSPGVDPFPFRPESGDERRAWQLGDRPDLAQPETPEPGPDVGFRREKRGRQRGKEGGLAAWPDDPRLRRSGVGGRDRRREPGAGDARPRRSWEDRVERGDEPPDELRLGAP